MSVVSNEKIEWKERIGMILGGVGGVPLFAIITAFLAYFYTNVVGLNPGSVGLIILVSKVFDGGSDLLFGSLIDKTRTKLGVSRPWIFKIAFFAAVGIIALFTVPNTGTTGKLIYVFVSYNVSQTVIYTILLLALTSLPTYMTRNSVKRSGLFVWCGIGQSIMTAVVASVTTGIVTSLGGDQKAWIIVSTVYALISGVSLIITGTLCKETVNPDDLKLTKEDVRFSEVIRSIVGNKYWVQVLLIVVFGAGVYAASSMMGIYYAEYILNDVNKAGLLNAAYTIPLIFVGFVLLPLIKKYSKKKIIFSGVLIQLLGCMLIIFFPKTIVIILVGTIMKSIGQSSAAAMYLPMLSDSIEYGQWKTGIRSQAALMGANGAGQKIGQGLVTALIGGLMAVAGFNGAAVSQSPEAINSISRLFLLVPLMFTVLELVVITFYDLDKHYSKIMSELSQRITICRQDEEIANSAGL